MIKKFLKWLIYFGFNPFQFISFIKGVSWYLSDYQKIKLQKGEDSCFTFGECMPMLNEKHAPSGEMSGNYFHQDIWAARKIFDRKPEKHVDIGSRMDGFVAHVAIFREIEVFDIRYQTSPVKNIVFTQADLMTLPDGFINYTDSISALHSLEHFGLGRYGDPIEYWGYKLALESIYKMLKIGGVLYLSLPIGKEQKIEFNAHRIFTLKYVIDLMKNNYFLNELSCINEKGVLLEKLEVTTENIEKNFNIIHGMGLFEFVKK